MMSVVTKVKFSKRKMYLAAAIVLAIVLVAIVFITLLGGSAQQTPTVRGSLEDRPSSTRMLSLGGATYPYDAGLTNILVMGVDQNADREERKLSFRSSGQADFLMLVTIDEKSRTVDLLQIDRDTLANITILTVLGQDAGTRKAQICLAHGFGGTRERSSQLTVKAVENFLHGVPIDHFVSINMGSIGAIADALGGIPVTMPEDLTEMDPTFVKGAEVLLGGDMANNFVRQRMDIGDGTNRMRMQRQKLFMDGFLGRVSTETAKGKAAANELFDDLMPLLYTSLSKGRIINLMFQIADYETSGITYPAGEHTVGANGFTEFHADQPALQQLVLERFTKDAR